jgi:hypothetical protein
MATRKRALDDGSTSTSCPDADETAVEAVATSALAAAPPFDARSWPAEAKEYVVLLMIVEDTTCTQALAACRRVCSSQVQECCGQWDGTRHITLLKGLKMTRDEAMRVQYAVPPACLPLDLAPTHLKQWEPTLALGFSGGTIGAADLAALADLREVPTRLAGRLHIEPSTMHVSLYRTGRAGMPKHIKEHAKQIDFPNMRRACADLPLGSVRGVKVVLKPIGGAYEESAWRVLA